MESIASGFLKNIAEKETVNMPPKKGAGTVRCPFCGSKDIEGDSYDVEGDQAELLKQDMFCNKCQK